MLPLVDANVVLRYLLNDVPSQAQRAREVIEHGCEASIEVIAEVAYVLEGVYGVPRAQVARVLLGLIDTIYVERGDELAAALEFYAEQRLDFVDCILLAQNQVLGREVVTFDKKLARLITS